MNVDLSQIENVLISEIDLSSIQARIFLLVVINGKMNGSRISKELDITEDEAINNSKKVAIYLN